MKGKINGAIIGCGAIARKHLQAFYDNQADCELTAVCDINRERAETIAEEYRNETGYSPDVYTEYKEIFRDETIDFAAVAVISSLHFSIAREGMLNKKHIILEKPIALGSDDAVELIRLAEVNGIITDVGYVTRFAPHIRALKEVIDKGGFGKILHAQVQINWNRSDDYFRQAPWRGTWENDGGMLMNQCTHGIDLLQWILGGTPKAVYGVLRQYQRPIEAEDFSSAIVEFDNDAVGTITGTINTYPSNHDATLTIIGETGTVVLGGKGINEVITWDFADPSHIKPEPSTYKGHSLLYKDFLFALQNGTDTECDFREGYKSVEIVLGIQMSMKEGKRITFPVSFKTKDMIGVPV